MIPLVLLAVRRPWAGAFFLLASAASAGVVQLIKSAVARERPADILVHSDFGSFPSGHTANAATMAVAFMILWPRVWVIVAGIVWTLLMAFSRTVLHAHWLSDTIGARCSARVLRASLQPRSPCLSVENENAADR